MAKCNRCGKCANGKSHDGEVYCATYYLMTGESPWRGKNFKACQFFKEGEQEPLEIKESK